MITSVGDVARRHPLWSVFVVALVARVITAVVIALVLDGAVFGDDTTYSAMARAMAEGDTESWNAQTRQLYRNTATFLVPLTALFAVFGPVQLVGQVYVALLGAATAVLTARVVLEVCTARCALLAGLAVALLPSQILWSSLTLKDAAVWSIMAALALVLALSGRMRGRRLLALAVAAGTLLFLLGHLRHHSLVVASWALAVAAWLGPRDGRVRLGVGGVLLAVAVPWAIGIGPAGLGLVTGSGPLAERRAANAVGADTAFVRGATDFEPELEDGSFAADLSHLPKGLAVMLLEPYPLSPEPNGRLRLAQAESLLWYPMLALGLLGVGRVWRLRAALAFPVLVGAGTAVLYALAEGNVGTAYRHRGEFVWVVALLASMGAMHLRRKEPAGSQVVII